MIVLHATWQRVALGGLLVFLLTPLLLAMALPLPLLIWREPGRKFVLDLFDKVTGLAKALLPPAEAAAGEDAAESLRIALPAAPMPSRQSERAGA
ncbi:hypothetical protein AB0B45_21130 [Nonomuraea sp. NPDC049152]|uniref:hypothetical protein n=1 Tax=Nonomuraea sp. NPDC049152 TaxID=3154350 RepID=UPI0033E800FE